MHDEYGNWIGIGLGDTGDKVTKIQHRLLKAFPANSHAVEHGVTESGTYDQGTADSVTDIATYLNETEGGSYRTDGVCNAALQERLGVTTASADRITYLSVNGTGVDMWTGYPADIGRALNPDKYYWQPIGYPAATFPMQPSVDEGVAELVNQIRGRKNDATVGTGSKFVLCGYSQGGLIVSIVWRDHILNPSGDLHDRIDDCLGVITYGNPMRAPGIANGNVYAGQAIPAASEGSTTGGIAAEEDLHPSEVPDHFLDFANDGDLYAACPVGDDPWNNLSGIGRNENLVYDIIQGFDWNDFVAIVNKVLELLSNPWNEVIPLVYAVYNGGLFFALGMNSPHYTYNIDAAVRWLAELNA